MALRLRLNNAFWHICVKNIPSEKDTFLAMAPDPLYFLSYSREQLLYTESFLIHLLRELNTIDLWLDLQQIQPGDDWQEIIQQGLDASSGVILLASKTAMASRYVELEWRHALEHNKPIFVVLLGWVRLPAILHKNAQAIIEGSHDFDRMIVKLKEAIQTRVRYRDPRTRFGWFGTPIPMPIEVWHISNIFLLNAIFFAGTAYYFPYLFVVSLAFFIFWVLWIRHRIGYDLFFALPRVLLIIHIVALFALVFAHDIQAGYKNETLPLLLLAVLSLILLVYAQAFYVTPTNPDRFVETGAILRWLPGTGATADRRRELNFPPEQRQKYKIIDPQDMARAAQMIKDALRNPDRTGSIPAAVTQRSKIVRPKPPVRNTPHFRVTAHPKDAETTKYISANLVARGAVWVEKEADYEIVIVSRALDKNQLGPALVSSGRIIPVLIESKPGEDVMNLLGRWQMVDYRSGDPAVLVQLGNALFNVRTTTTYHMIPQSFDKNVRRRHTPPMPIRQVPARGTIRLNIPPRLLAYLFVAALAGLFLLIIYMGATNPSPPEPPSAPRLTSFEVQQTLEAVRRHLNPP